MSWRTGFTLAEVQAGHAVDRLDADGRNLTDKLVEQLRAGDHFESVALLEAYLRQTDAQALVVVEDAVRDEANPIFDVMQTLDSYQPVSLVEIVTGGSVLLVLGSLFWLILAV